MGRHSAAAKTQPMGGKVKRWKEACQYTEWPHQWETPACNWLRRLKVTDTKLAMPTAELCSRAPWEALDCGSQMAAAEHEGKSGTHH